MRLPLVPQISTKDGVANSNARLTNVLKEAGETGDLACVRPAIQKIGTFTGNGKGLVAFNDRPLSVYEASIYDAEETLTQIYGGPPSVVGYDTAGSAFITRQTVFASDGTYYNVQSYFIYTSSDGESWDEYALPVTSSVWYAGAALGPLVVASAGDSQIAYSEDSGQTWTISPASFVASLATSNGNFIILKGASDLRLTTDGINFTTKAFPSVGPFWSMFKGDPVDNLVYGMSRRTSFVTPQQFAWSFDNCTSWSEVIELPLTQSSSDGWTSYAYDRVGEKFYVVGGVSADGLQKTLLTIDQSSTDTTVLNLAYGYAWTYIAFTDDGIFISDFVHAIRSDDGVVWSEPFALFPDTPSTAVPNVALGMFGLNGTLTYYGKYDPPDYPVRAAYKAASPPIYTQLSGDFFDFAQSTL